MVHSTPSRPVIVAIDGSKHALQAALWACEEAVDRGTTLSLVYVIECDVDDLAAEFVDAREALDEATEVIELTGKSVEMTSEILRGDPATRVIEASRSAQLVCVGAKGMHDSAPGHRGATGATIAESAFCPVVMVRRRSGRRLPPTEHWVVAVLDESPVSRRVMQTALDEAIRRDASLLALICWPPRTFGSHHTEDDLREELDRYLADCGRQDPDVRVCAASLPADLADSLASAADLDQLVLVGKNNPELITELIGPQARSQLRKTNCSVMVVREVFDTALVAS
jgi:nucleotide-binding universal stress UspA family protein